MWYNQWGWESEWTWEFGEIIRQPQGPFEVDGPALSVRPVGMDAWFSPAKLSCVDVSRG